MLPWRWKAGMVIVAVILMLVTGCGGTGEEKTADVMKASNDEELDVRQTETESSEPMDSKSEGTTMTVTDGASKSEVTVGSSGIVDQMPEDLPIPEDHVMHEDKLSSVKSGGITTSTINFDTDMAEADIIKLYKDYLENKGDFQIVETSTPPTLSGNKDEQLLYVILAEGEQKGVNVTVIHQIKK